MPKKPLEVGGHLTSSTILFLLLSVSSLAVFITVRARGEQDTTGLSEQEIRIFRANWRIPPEEANMSNAEILERMKGGRETWPSLALQLRAKLSSPQELDALANEFIAYANSVHKSAERRHLCSDVRDVFPDGTAIRVIRQTFPENPTYRELETWAGVIGAHPELSPEAAAEAAEFLNQLYQTYVDNRPNLEAVPGYDSREPGHIPILIVGGFGNCGEAGFHALTERNVIPFQETVFSAMGRIGTEGATQFIMDHYRASDLTSTRIDCLNGLALCYETRVQPGVRDFLRAELPQYLSAADPMTRLKAVRIAKLSNDAAFLEQLEELAANDPYTSQRYSDTPAPKRAYTVQEEAQQAIVKINKANRLYSERELLEVELSELEKRLAGYEADMYGNPHKDRYIERTLKKIEGVRQKLQALSEE